MKHIFCILLKEKNNKSIKSFNDHQNQFIKMEDIPGQLNSFSMHQPSWNSTSVINTSTNNNYGNRQTGEPMEVENGEYVNQGGLGLQGSVHSGSLHSPNLNDTINSSSSNTNYQSIIEIQPQEIQESESVKLGRGSFGEVSTAQYQHMTVAIKTFHTKSGLTAEDKNEIALLQHLNHRNIVRFYGLVMELQDNNRLILSAANSQQYTTIPIYKSIKLVMEYCSQGSVYHYLKSFAETNPNDLDDSRRLQIAYDLACGLSFLHSKKIVHRDIKSINAVLDEHGVAKWCDFGFSCLKEASTVHLDRIHENHEDDNDHEKKDKNELISYTWLAPEQFYRATGVPSRMSDIWSYGMLCYQLLTLQLPFQGAEWITVRETLRQRPTSPLPLPPTTNGSACEKLRSIIEKCWLPRDQRPTAGEIVDMLKSDAIDVNGSDNMDAITTTTTNTITAVGTSDPTVHFQNTDEMFDMDCA